MLLSAFFYSLIPAACAVLGGLIATFYRPTTRFISLLQHLVAGIVIAAVSVELLPKLLDTPSPIPIAVGFVIGIALMVGLHELAHFLSHQNGQRNLPLRMLGGSAIDLFVDGILIGLAFLTGFKSGVLIALSLTPCAFFLCLTLSSTLKTKKVGGLAHLLFILFIALMLPLGAFLGASLVENLPTPLVEEAIAASVAALLYLGIEEFLVEAHKTKDTHYTPLAFFFGFLLVLLFH